jgi:enoyl-CoA hydratase
MTQTSTIPAPGAEPAAAPVSVTREGGVATVVLQRPQRANALDRPLWDALRQTFVDLDDDPSVRVVVLAGAGRHFCAGIDLSMLAELQGRIDPEGCPGRGRDDLRRHILYLQSCLSAVEQCRVPVLAAIQGACIGAGLDLAAACDLRYATPGTRFCIKEVDMGLAADVGVLQRLPPIIGEGRTREIAYTGREVDGREAEAIGLASGCVEDDDPEALLAHVTALARSLAAKSPLAMRGTKHAITYARDHTVADALDHIATWNAAVLVSDDLVESVAAAREKRAPVYRD